MVVAGGACLGQGAGQGAGQNAILGAGRGAVCVPRVLWWLLAVLVLQCRLDAVGCWQRCFCECWSGFCLVLVRVLFWVLVRVLFVCFRYCGGNCWRCLFVAGVGQGDVWVLVKVMFGVLKATDQSPPACCCGLWSRCWSAKLSVGAVSS